MKKYLKELPDQYRKQLNTNLMNKTADEPLVDYVIDCFKSLEISPVIKIVKTVWNPKESDIDINKYIFKRDKLKKKREKCDYKFISDTRCGSLDIYVNFTLPVKDPKTGEITIQKDSYRKSILVPLIDENGYMFIKGKKYMLIYQISEKTTYVSKQRVTLKSLMPITMKRESLHVDSTSNNLIDCICSDDSVIEKDTKHAEDINGEQWILPIYKVSMFYKFTNVMSFFFAKGVEWSLDFLYVKDMITFVETPDYDDKDTIYFQIGSRCYLKVIHRDIFEKYIYIQGIVGSILDICTNRLTIDNIYDRNIWLKKLGGNIQQNAVEKGEEMLTFFNRLLDITTQKRLCVDEIHKQDIYSLIRWMTMNFNELRKKDNMSLYNKRIRCNEYISSILTMELSSRLNRVMRKGNKATMDTYKELFKFPGDIIIQKMNSSGVLRFDDNINDMDFFSKFKATFKGPHSQGNSNSNKISMRQKAIHPTYLGNFDVMVCSAGDPGTSTVLSPWGNIEGFQFDHDTEKDTFMYNFTKDMEKYKHKLGDSVEVEVNNEEDFYKAWNSIRKCNNDTQNYGSLNADNISYSEDYKKLIDDESITDNNEVDEEFVDTNSDDESVDKSE